MHHSPLQEKEEGFQIYAADRLCESPSIKQAKVTGSKKKKKFKSRSPEAEK